MGDRYTEPTSIDEGNLGAQVASLRESLAAVTRAGGESSRHLTTGASTAQIRVPRDRPNYPQRAQPAADKARRISGHHSRRLHKSPG